MQLLWSAVRHLYVIYSYHCIYKAKPNLYRVCINSVYYDALTDQRFMFASTQHNKSLSILQILLIFTSDPDCRIQVVLQIMIPAVCVLSRGFLFLLLLSHWDINPSLVRNSLVNLLMKRQYLSFNKITTLPHMSYRRNRFYQQNTRLLNLLWRFSISQMIYLNYAHRSSFSCLVKKYV